MSWPHNGQRPMRNLLLCVGLPILAGCAGIGQTHPQGTLPQKQPSGQDLEKTIEISTGSDLSFRDSIVHDLETVLFRGRPQWRQWGRAHLQTGDLVFTRGNHYIFFGTVNFTDLATKATGSQFSHVGMVAVIEDEPYVYDVSEHGVAKKPFDKYVTQRGFERVCVNRLKSEHYHLLPEVLAYLNKQEEKKTPFDKQFAPGDEALYCTELIVEAFRRAQQPVAQPQTIGELPGLQKLHPMWIALAKRSTHLDEDSSIYCIGDLSTGLMGSPLYGPLLASCATDDPPYPDAK